MIQTTIVPKDNSVQINVPNHYIGKKAHVIIYIDEEITETMPATPHKPSDFFGTLSLEDGNRMHIHSQSSRKEWSRDI